MNFLYLFSLLLLLSSCNLSQESSKSKLFIEDLLFIPQSPITYLKDINSFQLNSQADFYKKYFRVWNINATHISLNEAKWPYKSYRVGFTYGENLQLLDENFYKETLSNANYIDYLKINKKAVTLKLLNIRAMPTIKPILLNPSKAGEGYPFDYLQNSTVAANKPIRVSHYSQDKEWVFIESSFTYGWVKSADIVFVDENVVQMWKSSKQIFITQEGIPIYSKDGEFLFHSRIGSMFALLEEDKESYTILTVGKYKGNKALLLESKIDKKIASKGILEFKSTNIEKIIREVSKTHYGWGGLYGQRDCSSTLRDFYIPFGIWLPRNSYQQSLSGKRISLKGYSDKKKIEIIKKEALPFRTLFYKKGHIALYVGQYNNKSIVFQNIWGVKTLKNGKEGRFIIGKPIFSTLEVGSNLKEYDNKSSLLKSLESITTL